MSTVEDDIAAARAGDLEPLLARLRREQPPTTPGFDPADPLDPGTVGDHTWYEVLAAWTDGDLTDEQMDRCHDVVSR